MSGEPQTIHIYPSTGQALIEPPVETGPIHHVRRIIWWAVRVMVAVFAIVYGFDIRMNAAGSLASSPNETRLSVPTALTFQQALSSGNWSALTATSSVTTTHPGLGDLLFAGAIEVTQTGAGSAKTLSLTKQAIPASRRVSALAGTGEIAALALLDPLAAIFLALQKNAIVFSSLATLQAIAAFFATLAVSSVIRAKEENNAWFWVSAVAMGCALSSSSIALVVLVILVPYVLITRMRQGTSGGPSALGWLAITVVAFAATNPYVWADPLHHLLPNLRQAGGLRAIFSSGGHAPIYQQIVALVQGPSVQGSVGGIPWQWPIILLGILGVHSLWNKNRLFVAWLVLGLLSLVLFFHAQPPEYTLVLTAPLCLSAAAGLESVVKRASLVVE